MPEPFPNESEQTKAELEKILTAHRNFSERDDDYQRIAVEEQDNDLDKTFVDLARVLDLDKKEDEKIKLTKEKLEDIISDTRTIVLRQKRIFDRPRPKHLTDFHDINMVPEKLKTSHTPAYPSGHAFQSHIIAMVLSEKYPEDKDVFFELAKEITDNRVTAGVHYPSDSAAGIELAKILYDKLDLDKIDI